jgi:hypothetical protein
VTIRNKVNKRIEKLANEFLKAFDITLIVAISFSNFDLPDLWSSSSRRLLSTSREREAMFACNCLYEERERKKERERKRKRDENFVMSYVDDVALPDAIFVRHVQKLALILWWDDIFRSTFVFQFVAIRSPGLFERRCYVTIMSVATILNVRH